MPQLLRKALLHVPFVLVSATGLAQTATTSLRGVVTDPSGAVVPGAAVTLLNKSNGRTIRTTAKASGEYQFLQIAPAKYEVSVTAPSFGTITKTAELLVAQPATVNFTLNAAGTHVEVDVSANTQTLNTTDATLGTATSNETIQALPSESRNIPDLLSLNPGVFFLPLQTGANPAFQDSRSGAVNGGHSDQSNVTLDGLDNNDQIRGLAFTGVLRATQDSTEEFRVTTSNANSDQGRSSGAQISIVTKSGTNQFHGALYEYFRPTFTVANDFFNKQAQLESGLPNRPPKVLRHIFGGDIGGPILKDKLFFFYNYEGQRQSESAVVSQTVPTALYRQGILQYTDVNGNTQQISMTQMNQMDTANGCSVCNTSAYPHGPGANPNALAYFQSMPAANTTSGSDGLNEANYVFTSPQPIRLNTNIVKLDWTPTSRQHIFVRGNLQKDIRSSAEHFPGQGPSSILVDNTKGISAGHTWTLTSNLVNDLRYGYIRQGYASSGVGKGDYVDFRFLASPTSESRNSIVSVPVNNIIDNFSYNKGNHTFQIGGNWRLVYQNLATDANSYNTASTNPYWLRNNGNPPGPTALGLPDISAGFLNSYQIAYANLIGTVPSVTNVYNYAVSSTTSGSLLPDGALISRSYKSNEFEYYLQDSWRPTNSLTITFGIRHSILQTPWETHGQQVSPTIDTDTWFRKRQEAASQGSVYEERLNFAPSGPYYGKPGYWAKQKLNIAPRLAIAYAPDSKTSIRLGIGQYYDHYGQGLVNTYSQRGSFGLSSRLTSVEATYTDATSPRFTDRNTLPFSNGAAPATTSFPYQYPDAFAIVPGLDSKQKTPYTIAADFSIQRQLAGGFTLETTYVGRFGRHIVQTLDLGMPTNYVDPQGGGDYYSAGTAISKFSDAHNQDPTALIAPIPYFEHVFGFMKNTDYVGESATQALYSDEWAYVRASAGATTALTDVDYNCVVDPSDSPYACPAGYVSKFWHPQFSSLYSLATIGTSNYNALQVTLRHPMKHGFQADVSYTLSKSLDTGSDAERTSIFNSGVASTISEILNTWEPNLNYSVSDFDTRHLFTVNYVYLLPVGKGNKLFGTMNRAVDAVVGGWQLTGILRATSGLPWAVFEPGWTTNWEEESYGVVTDKHAARVRRHFDGNMTPQFFNDANTINNGIISGGPIRLPYPGEAGERNNLRGDGYFSWDTGLNKFWSLGDVRRLRLGWEVYNVTNTTRFDPLAIGAGLSGGSLGQATSTLGDPRRMQFSLRFDF